MVDIVALIHGYNFFLICTVALITGIWGLVLYFRKRDATRPWYILLYIVGGLGLLQGLLGVTLVLLGQKPAGGQDLYWLHYVYGGIVAFALPVALTYTTNGKNRRLDILVYSLAVLVLAAASVRGWITGPLPGHLLIPFVGS
jgi:heme A synthase